MIKRNVSAFINNSIERQGTRCVPCPASSIFFSLAHWDAFNLFTYFLSALAARRPAILFLFSLFLTILSSSPFTPLFLFPPFSFSCLRGVCGLATAGQTSRRGDACGSPMQLADSEVQLPAARSESEWWGKGEREREKKKLDNLPGCHYIWWFELSNRCIWICFNPWSAQSIWLYVTALGSIKSLLWSSLYTHRSFHMICINTDAI